MMAIRGKHGFYKLFAFPLGEYPGFLDRIGWMEACCAKVSIYLSLLTHIIGTLLFKRSAVPRTEYPSNEQSAKNHGSDDLLIL